MSDQLNIVRFPDRKAIEEEAARWVARLDARGELTATELASLKQWVSQSSQHKEAIDRMSALWGGFDILDEVNYTEEVVSDIVQPAWFNSPKWWATGAIAATLLIVSLVGMLNPQQVEMGLPQAGHYYTAIGEQRTIALADGSEVILNTNSEVKFELTDTVRNIHLVKGEAHFEVASDKERPFLVHANGGIVKAVGTAFTVFLRKKAVEVTVSEGVVALFPQSEGSVVDEALGLSVASLTPVAALTAGQNAVFSEEVESMTRMSDEALDRKLLWRGGFIAFAGEPLATVVADVSRYTDVVIEIDDPALEQLPVGGYFKVGEVEGMFEALEGAFGVSVERLSPTKVKLSQAS
ncbi:MAG: FecR domain-containing protein [Kordiimonas sp.]